MQKRMAAKDSLKEMLGELPLTAELYWLVRQRGKVTGDMSLKKLAANLPEWRRQVAASPYIEQPGKRILLFTTLRYWTHYSALLGLGLAGLGHQVTLAYLPYGNWRVNTPRFDLRRQNLYVQDVLKTAQPFLNVVSFYDAPGSSELPPALQEKIALVSYQDTQYTRQVEEVDRHDPLYLLRLQRNTQAAGAALGWLKANTPDVVIVPNGSILEFGAVYQAARYLDFPAVTYEFGEQRRRIWFALNEEVMQQDTTRLWAACKDQPFSEEQLGQLRELFDSRQKASLWENFSRRWQNVPAQGGELVRQQLNLDERPVALLAANVIGDSLTLGRQVFSQSMTEWLVKTLQVFKENSGVQLIIRIHPGERYTKGPSVADVVRGVLPELPEHIHLVAFDAPVNTYDLVQIADVGLVYTTTVGLEMAMSGVPVIAAGRTHYRGRGFTLDADSWQAYFQILETVLANPASLRLDHEKLRQAWHYAYCFFFAYPMVFPWHLQHLEKDTQEWQLSRVLSTEGQAEFSQTFRRLTGEARQW